MTPDRELLRQYAEKGSEAAFTELVRRHVDLVYSVARRAAAGDAHLAQDVTQTVFADLARKAGILCRRATLAGWLHTSARFAAGKAIRTEQRRRAREQESLAMNENPAAGIPWEQLRPVLDESVGRLSESDRDVIVLRFYQGMSHQEIGDVLGLSENSANKRVARALEKLRGHFARHGVTASAALLGEAISANSVQAAPAGLAAKVTPPALTAASGASAGSTFLFAMIMNTKTKITLAAVAVLAGLALWWNLRPTARTPNMAAQAMKPVPKAVARPVLSAAPPKVLSEKTIPASSAAAGESADPQSDLKTAIPDIARLIREGGKASVAPVYDTPDNFAKLNPQKLRLAQRAAENELQTPEGRHTLELFAQAYEALENQIPTYNASGNEATYMYSDLGPDGTWYAPHPLVFVKIDGKWYFRDVQ